MILEKIGKNIPYTGRIDKLVRSLQHENSKGLPELVSNTSDCELIRAFKFVSTDKVIEVLRLFNQYQLSNALALMESSIISNVLTRADKDTTSRLLTAVTDEVVPNLTNSLTFQHAILNRVLEQFGITLLTKVMSRISTGEGLPIDANTYINRICYEITPQRLCYVIESMDQHPLTWLLSNLSYATLSNAMELMDRIVLLKTLSVISDTVLRQVLACSDNLIIVRTLSKIR